MATIPSFHSFQRKATAPKDGRPQYTLDNVKASHLYVMLAKEKRLAQSKQEAHKRYYEALDNGLRYDTPLPERLTEHEKWLLSLSELNLLNHCFHKLTETNPKTIQATYKQYTGNIYTACMTTSPVL